MGVIDHHTLLFTLKRWQIRAALRGYYRRERPVYEASRLLGLWLVSCQRSKDQPPLRLTDLVTFPWDSAEKPDELSEEEVANLQRMLIEENSRKKRSQS